MDEQLKKELQEFEGEFYQEKILSKKHNLFQFCFRLCKYIIFKI